MPVQHARRAPMLSADASRDLATHADTAAALLKCLANPHRLMILCALAEGELSVGVLNEHIPLSQSALSQHLAVLRNEKLVNTRRESQTIYYSVVPGSALDIVHLLHDQFCCRVNDRSTAKSTTGAPKP